MNNDGATSTKDGNVGITAHKKRPRNWGDKQGQEQLAKAAAEYKKTFENDTNLSVYKFLKDGGAADIPTTVLNRYLKKNTAIKRGGRKDPPKPAIARGWPFCCNTLLNHLRGDQIPGQLDA